MCGPVSFHSAYHRYYGLFLHSTCSYADLLSFVVPLMSPGSTVARYSGDTVHRRFKDLDQYKNAEYEAGMRRAFLKTDEDLRSGA